MKRVPMKRSQVPLKKSGNSLKKGNSKMKSRPTDPKYLLDRKEQQERDWEFYQMIWEKRGPYSEISGTYLGAEVNKACIDHLIEKSSHPELRYEEGNILLVTIDEHYQKTNGFALPKHKEAIALAKEKYNVI